MYKFSDLRKERQIIVISNLNLD